MAGLGIVAAGQRADLILLAGNPLDDVANVRAPRGVMARGRWLTAERLAQMVADAALAGGPD